MAMETPTTAIPNTIQSVQRSSSSGKTDAVGRRGDANASPFAPQTNVSIQSSIDDMSAVLSRLTAQESSSTETIPQQLQQIIQNVLQKSFSLDATLANGLGSTMESQRFSTEQLLTFARILSQMGVLADNGNMGELSENLQAVLQNFKELLTTENSSLEPALLNKTAFQLLNGKTTEDLSSARQLLVASLGVSNASSMVQQGSPDNSLGFLKQLMQYLMPSGTAFSGQSDTTVMQQPSNSNTTQAQEQTTQNGNTKGQAAQATLPDKTANFSPGSDSNTGSRLLSSEETVPGQGNVPGQKNGTDTEARAGDNSKKTAQQNMAEATKGSQGKVSQETTAASSKSALVQGNSTGAAENATSGNVPAQQQGKAAAETMNRSVPQGQNMQGEAAPTAGQAASVSQPMQNTTQLMDTMKSLAQLLLKDASLNNQDAQLLQNFVNGRSSTLSEKDAKQLQLLLRLCQSNVPAVVQQAASQQNMPDMPKLWAFMQLCDMASVKEMKSRELKNASKNIADFATSMKHSWNGESNSQGIERQQSMNFMMPLYMGDNEKGYPAYIHVYDQKEHTNEQGEVQGKETWLRLCVLTDNIGAVELVCQVYDKQNLNMRLFFSDESAVQSFRDYAPELQNALKDSSLVLKDFKFGLAGRKL